MTVKELKAKLATLPPELDDVTVCREDAEWGPQEIDEVEVVEQSPSKLPLNKLTRLVRVVLS